MIHLGNIQAAQIKHFMRSGVLQGEPYLKMTIKQYIERLYSPMNPKLPNPEHIRPWITKLV